MAEITFLTQPAKIAYPLHRHVDEYEKVIGIDFEGSTTTLSRPGFGNQTEIYSPAEAQPLTLDLPLSLAIRTKAYFDRFVARPGFLRPYNCHTFANYASGGFFRPDMLRYTGYLERLMRESEIVEPPLPVGTNVLVGSQIRSIGTYENNPEHSLVSLGEMDPRCIEVKCLRGDMAITTYAASLAHQQLRQTRTLEMFARGPSSAVLETPGLPAAAPVGQPTAPSL